MTFGVGFVTAPLLARTLGPEGRGLLAAIAVPFAVAPWVFQFGTGMFAVKEAARGVAPRVLLGSLGAVNLAFGVVAAVGGIGIAAYLAEGRSVVEHYLILGFLAMPAVLVLVLVSDILWGLERWRPVVHIRILPSLFGMAGIVALYVAGHLTVAGAAAVTILASLAPVVPAVVHARRFGRPAFRPAVARGAMTFGGKVWLGTLAQTANARLDQLMMITLVSTRELGLYAIAVTIAGAAGAASAPLASMALPRVAGADRDFAARATRLGILAAGAAGIVVGGLVPLLVPVVFTDRFSGAVPLVELLLVAGVFSAGAAVLRPALAMVDRPGVGTISEAVSLAVTVPGLIVLLPRLGATGAALVSIVAYAASFLVLTVSARRRFGLPIAAFVVPRPADARWLAGRLARVARGPRREGHDLS